MNRPPEERTRLSSGGGGTKKVSRACVGQHVRVGLDAKKKKMKTHIKLLCPTLPFMMKNAINIICEILLVCIVE